MMSDSSDDGDSYVPEDSGASSDGAVHFLT